MKIIAWNINGMRSIIQKDHLFNLINEEQPTIICFGETKLSCPIIDTEKHMLEKVKGYKYRYYSTCNNGKGGYSGTAIYSKKKPLNIIYGLNYNNANIDDEGRVITLEFKKFYLIHVYTPNSGLALARLDYRINTWDIAFKKYLNHLQKTKPLIVCGDLNVANEDIDIRNVKSNKRTAGFTDEERDSFKKLLNDVNLIDTYRYKNPDKIEYSYWTYRMNARKKNVGWRIDYFLVSDKILKKVKKAKILTQVLGSDHAPVKLNITFKDI
jgi:exodeoxyribonuclease-3